MYVDMLLLTMFCIYLFCKEDKTSICLQLPGSKLWYSHMYPRQNAGHVLFFETFACPIAHPTALEHCFADVSSAENTLAPPLTSNPMGGLAKGITYTHDRLSACESRSNNTKYH